MINLKNDCREKHNCEQHVNNENIFPVGTETWYKNIDSQGRYLCKFCDNTYSTIQTVRHHVKTKHSDKWNEMKSIRIIKLRTSKLKCHICKYLFKSTVTLQDHIKSHGVENIKKSCFICHATFINDTEILTHLVNEHESVKRRLHCCSICGYSTPKLSHFKQHEKTHLCTNQIKCSKCDYSTYHTSNMKIHERIHFNYKPYMCMFPDCGYRCATKSGLSSHELQHEKERKFIYCDKCNYKTVYKQSLKKHIDSHRRNSLKCN
ncbi:PR domain zinc finger protein 5-like isoform X2 [Spodoptera litura]|nr:PR domain zinc finger protein 5-like isoform X2 [Spodoptera litura]